VAARTFIVYYTRTMFYCNCRENLDENRCDVVVVPRWRRRWHRADGWRCRWPRVPLVPRIDLVLPPHCPRLPPSTFLNEPGRSTAQTWQCVAAFHARLTTTGVASPVSQSFRHRFMYTSGQNDYSHVTSLELVIFGVE